MKVLLSGGGTGGHVYPAIAIADKIKENHPEAEILFVGTENGIESEIVPKSGYRIKTITVQGFRRKLSIDNVKRVVKLGRGLLQARRIVKKFKPDIAIGTGGYVSGPILYCASSKKVVTVIHEQNSFPGITNKILSKRVSLVMTNFEDAKDRFPEDARKKILNVGNPVRRELLSVNRDDAKKVLGVPLGTKMVLVYGGSGGFDAINNSMAPVIKHMVERDVAFIFATGKSYYDCVNKELEGLNFKTYQKVVPYLDDMANALAASDLVIGSAGATSLSEITALGRASIIIPKSYTAENHQEYNARSVERAGAGVCLLESEVNGKVLSDNVFRILDDKAKLAEMERCSYKIGQRDAVDRMYDEIMKKYK